MAATTTILACLSSEDGYTRMDSKPKPVDDLTSSDVCLKWAGDVHQPVLALDGFSAQGEMLTIALRLKQGDKRLALCKAAFSASRLVYGASGSPRGGDKTENRRRHSVYGYEEAGVSGKQVTQSLLLSETIAIGYVASSYKDEHMTLGHIVVVRLEFISHEPIRSLLTYRGHKVACLIRTSSEYSKPSATYLGRAQEINTSETSTRTYRWLSKQSDMERNPFRETGSGKRLSLVLPPPGHELENDADLQLICTAATVYDPRTPRALQRSITLYNAPYVQDSDAYSNVYCQLPIVVQQREVVVIEFFNFKASPPFGPHRWSLTLKWSDFTAQIPVPEEPVTPRRMAVLRKKPKQPAATAMPVAIYTLNRKLSSLQCGIEYAIDVIAKTCTICKLSLGARDFEKSLVQ